LPLLWLPVVLALLFHQWHFWQAPRIDVDIFALLPEDTQTPAVQRAMTQLSAQGERRMVVMIGGGNWAEVQAASHRFNAAMLKHSADLKPALDMASTSQTQDFYAPWRDALLTDQQRESLQHASLPALSAQAMGLLHGFRAGQPTSWIADPIGLWSAWWSQRAGMTNARPRDGLLWLKEADADREWAVLMYETTGPVFRMDGQRRWGDALADAEKAADSNAPGQLSILAAGVPLHAEAAAAQGNHEMNTIGLGSLIAVIALVLLVFRALGPITLTALSLLIGCAAGLSVTVLVFGQVHLLTLVFGASLVGVAEDFGIHYFSSRLGHPKLTRWALMKRLLPGLLLALATSVLGYLVLAVVPFPGLRQMALFSAVGLIGAFATVVCWLPWLDRSHLKPSGFANAIAASLGYWPALKGRALWATLAAASLFCIVGITQVHMHDDLRQLQSSPPALIKAQMAVGRLLQTPSPAQFFLVNGATEDEVLQREEALKDRLKLWQKNQSQALQNIQLNAVSDWVPSRQRQTNNRALTQQWETAVLAEVGQTMGESLARPRFAPEPLSIAQWLAAPASESLRAQWLGQQNDTGLDKRYASVILVRGLNSTEQAKALSQFGHEILGVKWVDRTADISQLLEHFRTIMAGLLLVGHIAVLMALFARFKRSAWRAWLPCALASLLTVAMLGYMNEPLQLFNLLALMLLLGMGVDYGIFLLEHPGDGQGFAWLAVLVGAISTGLSFGLLALSSTPALRAFGLTMLIGLSAVCFIAPLLRLTQREETTPT